MKLYRQLIILGAAAGLMIPGCTPEEETLIDTGDELTITASAKDITLLESEGEQEALKLTWTPASGYGLEEEPYYTLDITKSGSDYEDGYSRDMGKSTFSISWIVAELNTFLTEVLGAESGTKTAYKARIRATIYGRDDLTQTAETEFSATAFTPASYTLYIDGSALTNPDAGQMTRGEAGQFTWTGVLEEGGIVFTVSEDSEWPCYGAGEGDGELKYFNEDPGAVSPMGLINEKQGTVLLVVDRDLLDCEYIGCHPCVNTATVTLKMADLLEKFVPATGHSCRIVELRTE